MSKARDLANLGSNTSSLATDSEVTAAVSPKADSSTVSAHTGASTNVHGVTGAVVGTTDTQTLTNKSLTQSGLKSPIELGGVNGAVLNGAAYISIDLDPSLSIFTANATGNFYFNLITGVAASVNALLANGNSYTFTALTSQGSTAYYCTGINIDGVSQTIKWSGGTAPTAGNASSIDAYSFTVIKTASATYKVLGAGPIKYA